MRGPRAEEDNTEWIKAMFVNLNFITFTIVIIDLRQMRKEEREKEKAYKRANLTHIQKVLNRQSEYWTDKP